jgi:hypothetical protein
MVSFYQRGMDKFCPSRQFFLTDSKLAIMKNALIIGLLLLCQYGIAEEIELPAYFPFLPLTPNQNQIPLTGEPSTIPSDFDKNAILFFFHKDGTNYSPMGTGFIMKVSSLHYPHIYIPLPFVGKNAMVFHPWYFVTAKHVLFDAKGNLHPDVYLRFNNNTNGVTFVPITSQITNGALRVLFSTNTAVDMAIITIGFCSANTNVPIPYFPNNISMGTIDSSLLLTPEKMSKDEIKEGYDMFFIGLFVQFYGSNRNIPVCRFGHLAMIPDEPISFAGLPPQKLFLMETSAYGGNSGSPAFFRTERSIPILKTMNLLSSKSGEHDKITLAGIVEGDYLFPTELYVSNSLTSTPILENAGIAAVVPATYIHEVLFSKDEIENRKFLFKILKPKGYF